jgi:hypothetical protein
MTSYNTNLAAEYHVLSMLHRLGFDASLTLGNKKAVDVVVVRDTGNVATVDVKGLSGTTSWPVDNVTKSIAENHFLVFVSFLGKISEHEVLPEVYVVPSESLAPLIYHSPSGSRHVLPLSRMRKDGKVFLNAWSLLRWNHYLRSMLVSTLVGSHIQMHYQKWNVWLPAKDTGVDLLVTNGLNTKAVSIQVKFSKDFDLTIRPILQHKLISAGWWALQQKKIKDSRADFWVFALSSFTQR